MRTGHKRAYVPQNVYMEGGVSSNFRLNISYTVYSILFGCSLLRGTLLYKFCWIVHPRTWERVTNVCTYLKTCTSLNGYVLVIIVVRTFLLTKILLLVRQKKKNRWKNSSFRSWDYDLTFKLPDKTRCQTSWLSRKVDRLHSIYTILVATLTLAHAGIGLIQWSLEVTYICLSRLRYTKISIF